MGIPSSNPLRHRHERGQRTWTLLPGRTPFTSSMFNGAGPQSSSFVSSLCWPAARMWGQSPTQQRDRRDRLISMERGDGWGQLRQPEGVGSSDPENYAGGTERAELWLSEMSPLPSGKPPFESAARRDQDRSNLSFFDERTDRGARSHPIVRSGVSRHRGWSNCAP